jgi:signal transduction histidine kinase
MVTGTVAPDHVTIAIADTGDGIPADQLEAIFRRFHRVDPARRALDDSGSGLGLTIARAIVQDHGGDIVADSPGLGRGTTVTVTLPRFTPPHAQTVSV